MANITAIRELVDVLQATRGWRDEDVSVYLNAIPAWTELVLSVHNWWSTARPQRYGTQSLDTLQMLAPLLDEVTPNYPPDLMATLRTNFGDLVTLLVDDDTLPQELRRHFTLLLGHMKRAIDDFAITGDFELYRANVALLTLIRIAENETKKPTFKERWKAMAAKFLAPQVVPAAIKAAEVYAKYELGAG